MKAALARVGAVAGKEVKHLLRDLRILAIVLILPVVQLLLFAYAISFDVKNVPTVVLDQDNTPASRHYVQTYRSSEFFDVLGSADDLAQVDRLFDQNRVRIAVIVPSGFARSIDAGEKAQVAVLTDGSEPNSAQLARAYATALNATYGQQVLIAWADRQGLNPARAGSIEPRLRTWYNPEGRSSNFLIPGLMVVIIMIVTVQQTAVTLVREREQGTAEQMTVSPLRRGELMVGKLLPWTLLAFADMLVIAVISIWVFGLPLRGSAGFLAVSSVVFVFAALGLGLIISAVAPSLETANISGLLIAFLPAFLLSGFAFPLDSIPVPLQWLSYAFPGRYMVAITRGVFLKGAGFPELWPQLAALAGYALVVLLASSVLYRRRST
ncbi:MAG TPA: ABC transporter permease [Propionibacteriaceae bacterium]|nr:ABC transporter permease [Propionibacteriaceae bacterium]